MDIPSNLRPILRQVFPETITQENNNVKNDWIDLKDKTTRKPDNEKQSNEIMFESNRAIEGLERYDDDIVYFFEKNISDIPKEKIQELVPLLFEYIQANPMSDLYYEGVNSFSAKKLLGIIIANEPKYITAVTEFLSDDNFLVRWAGVGLLFRSYSESNESLDMTESLSKLNELYEKELNKKISTEEPDIKITYYQINELYAEYMNELKVTIDYFKAN